MADNKTDNKEDSKLESNANAVCLPGHYDKDAGTCFTTEQLMEMAGAYNRYVTKERVGKTGLHLITIKNDKKYLLKQLRSKFEKECAGDEVCITKQKFMTEVAKEMKHELKTKTFRDKGPAGPDEWLGTDDIDKLLKPYEQIYPDYKFMGAVPANCLEVKQCALYEFDFGKQVSKGKTRIGIIFNLDTYGMPGSHWVSMFINIPKGLLYYCDSAGAKPTPPIAKFVSHYKAYCKANSITYLEEINRNRYQFDPSECGVYSSNFQIRMLGGESFDKIVSKALNFKEINSCRNAYFSNQPVDSEPNKLCDPGRAKEKY